MEKDGLIIVAVMLVSFVVLALSVGKITGLVTNDSEIEEPEESICEKEGCDPETCQQNECPNKESCGCNKEIK
jgi:hypothetical protein